MKTRIFALLTAWVWMVLSAAAVSAAPMRLADEASLLTLAEKNRVQKELDRISTTWDFDVVVVTVPSLNGKSAMEAADDFYEEGGYSEDGVLLLITMAEREWWISTAGSGISLFSDRELDFLEDCFLEGLSDGEYENAFLSFAAACEEVLQPGKTPERLDRYGEEELDGDWGDPSARRTPGIFSIVISVVIGLVAAVTGTGAMKSALKSVQLQPSAANYVRPNSLRVTNSREIFLYRHLSRTAKPKDNGGPSGSHGGGSVHHSSSGSSHGGRGGRF